jgi:hypothetical protein
VQLLFVRASALPCGGEPKMLPGHHKTPKKIVTSGDRGNSNYSVIVYLTFYVVLVVLDNVYLTLLFDFCLIYL